MDTGDRGIADYGKVQINITLNLKFSIKNYWSNNEKLYNKTLKNILKIPIILFPVYRLLL